MRRQTKVFYLKIHIQSNLQNVA